MSSLRGRSRLLRLRSTTSVHGDAIKALDALDALLIAALTELQELSDEEEPVDREGQLRRIWRSTFAHYSASEERRLEEIFVDRGRALVRNI